MYELYRVTKETFVEFEKEPSKELIISQDDKLSISTNGLKSYIYWNLITFGKCRVFSICDKEGKLVHYSYVVEKCWKFPFLQKADFEIGPCETAFEFRGQGIYPYVLSCICKNKLRESNCAYMIVDSNNISSIRGITKCGFKKIMCLRRDLIKRYVRTDKMEIL